jgi:hypothetical protein
MFSFVSYIIQASDMVKQSLWRMHNPLRFQPDCSTSVLPVLKALLPLLYIL